MVVVPSVSSIKFVLSVVVKEAVVAVSMLEYACTSLPIATPKLVLASDAVVAPVPPFTIAIRIATGESVGVDTAIRESRSVSVSVSTYILPSKDFTSPCVTCTL